MEVWCKGVVVAVVLWRPVGLLTDVRGLLAASRRKARLKTVLAMWSAGPASLTHHVRGAPVSSPARRPEATTTTLLLDLAPHLTHVLKTAHCLWPPAGSRRGGENQPQQRQQQHVPNTTNSFHLCDLRSRLLPGEPVASLRARLVPPSSSLPFPLHSVAPDISWTDLGQARRGHERSTPVGLALISLSLLLPLLRLVTVLLDELGATNVTPPRPSSSSLLM